jgi:hypothetical protein
MLLDMRAREAQRLRGVSMEPNVRFLTRDMQRTAWLKLSARAIRYRTSDFEAWLASRACRSTSDAGNNNA